MDVDIGISAEARSELINHLTQQDLSVTNSSISLTTSGPSSLFLPSSFHLAPKQQGIFSRLFLLVVFCLHTDVLDLSAHHSFTYDCDHIILNKSIHIIVCIDYYLLY